MAVGVLPARHFVAGFNRVLREDLRLLKSVAKQ
jgi:hypothetical protein